MDRRRLKKKVVVALSGGVDSSVSAALLKEQGYDVIGVFMKVWAEPTNNQRSTTNNCPWIEDQFEARRAAGYLGIPFYTINLEKEYKEAVVDYFFREYAVGRTPNPDVLCNSEIKFGVFLKRMLEMGADYVATGHYARLQTTVHRLRSTTRNRRPSTVDRRLLRGIDPKKDQSYFLWRLNQDQFKHILFPVGGYTKAHVRELARQFGLPNADRKDSQGICFIGPVDVVEFLKTQLPVKKGLVVTTDGQKIGEHDGVWFYTIGQRHGWIPIGQVKKLGRLEYDTRPALYVVDKNVERNMLFVGPTDDPKLWARGMVASEPNWLVNSKLKTKKSKLQCQCQIRYQQKPVLCQVEFVGEDRVNVQFDESLRAVTPGQSAVFYNGNLVLGGGVIENAIL